MIVKSEKYWADLLEQYKLGSISESDRFELEKKALDDPFLFDALEGYSTVTQNATPQKEEKTKLLTLPRMAAAASVVFLVAMIFLLKNDNTQELTSDQPIAMVLDKSAEEEEVIVPAKGDADIEEASKISSTNQNLEESKTKPTQNTNNQKPSRKKEKALVVEESNIETDKAESIPLKSETSTVRINKDTEEIESDDFVKETTEDEVHIPNNVKKLEASPKESQLDLDTPDSGSQATADNNAPLPIAKAKKAKKTKAPSTFYIVEPAIGKKDFEEFVKESIDKRGLRQDIPQDVTIEFDIDKNGELSRFLHIYNGCSECGGFAIYLMGTSGAWKTSPEGQEGRARYTLKF